MTFDYQNYSNPCTYIIDTSAEWIYDSYIYFDRGTDERFQ